MEIHTKKSKAVPVTGRGDRYGCETSRLSHFLDSQLPDGSEVVSLTCQPAFISFLLEPESTPGPYCGWKD
jgi:hypothetical protein